MITLEEGRIHASDAPKPLTRAGRRFPRVLFVLALGTVSLGGVLLAPASGPSNGCASPGPRANWPGNAQSHIQARESCASRAGLQAIPLEKLGLYHPAALGQHPQPEHRGGP